MTFESYKNKHMKRNVIFIYLILHTFLGFSQKDNIRQNTVSADSLLELSLDELMNMKVSISTKTPLDIRITPGIVSVITEKEIRQSGARDLLELIQCYVPGFEFGSEIEGAVGLAIRGIWCIEGKLLLLINGMEINEIMFGTTIFGNRFFLENVERVEIVRGPGSVVYGGYAGMGVINIITKTSDKNGNSIAYSGSHTGKSFAHNNFSFRSHLKNNDFKLNVFGNFSNGTRSDKELLGVLGDRRTMSGNSFIKNRTAGIQFDYQDFKLNAIISDHNFQTIDLWDTIYQGVPLVEHFSDFLTQASYTFKLNKNISVNPTIAYKWQKPWNLDAPLLNYTNNKTAEKLKTGVMGRYQNKKFYVISGFDYFFQMLRLPKDISPLEELFGNGSNKMQNNTIGIFAEAGLETKFANFTAGVRFDKSDLFKPALVPRLAITKTFRNIHFKLAANKSFRSPGGILPCRIEGFESLIPEKLMTYEFETGLQIPDNFYMTLNFFYTNLSEVITYQINPDGIGTYVNGGYMGTQGVETVLQYNSEKFSGELNFAYYQRIKNKKDSAFIVENNERYFLSFSPVKINVLLSYAILKDLRFNANTSFFGPKFANTHKGLEKIKSQALIHFNVYYSNFIFKGLDLSVGINNILNSDFRYYSGSNSDHAPIPGLDRSIQLKVSYSY